jgi:hypothetical protein
MKTAATHGVGMAEGPTTKSFTRHLPRIAQFLMGLPLIVFGLDGFFNFFPPAATPLPEEAAAFAGALAKTGYMLQLIGATQLIVGLLLILNRFVPLALALFAPFIINSIAFHLRLEHSGFPMAAVFLILEIYLAWAYRDVYRPMLVMRATPK